MISLKETNYFNEAQLKTLSRRSVRTISDLLFYLPRKYIDRSKPFDFRTTHAGDTVTLIGEVVKSQIFYGRKPRLTVTVVTNGAQIDLVFFRGVNYFKKILSTKTHAAFSGKVEIFRGRVNIVHPEIEKIESDELVHSGKIVPIYHITDAMKKSYLSSRVIRNAVHKALKQYGALIKEHLPEAVIKENSLPGLSQTFQWMHFPDQMSDVEKAANRLAFDELLVFSAMMQQKSLLRKKIKKLLQVKDLEKENDLISALINSLPFSLTADQQKAIDRLIELAQNSWPFAVLLQGDVGSGKTLVALVTALFYIERGIQVVLMAPTEILARQHYRSFLNYLGSLGLIQVELILGKEKASERKAKLERISRGDSQLVIGTHAVIQPDVTFASLGLVIIDEQHRFGVEQRELLRKKGDNPDMLAMTATPIPRSLSLTLYADLESVIIKEKPPGRKPIDTRLFNTAELELLYQSVKKYIDQGRQAYIVYPLIDESEKTDWASLTADYHNLENSVFRQYRLGLLHGRLSQEEKDRAMQKFAEGTIQILVTTTVIEVGVDVPNASIMLIRNAEKFGLSQLHQLRGRVGRGEHQSFCILVKSEKCTEEGEQRLNAMLESEDGFYLAQKDLEIRGTGEMLGVKQAGMSEFKIADLRVHTHLVEKTQKVVEQHPQLVEKLKEAGKWQALMKKGLVLFSN